MSQRLAGERTEVTVEGVTVEVEAIAAWAIYQHAMDLSRAYWTSAGSPALVALRRLYGYFVAEAQPTWQIIDHRGVIPATAAGMLRFPLPIGLNLVLAWAGAFVAEPVAEPATPSAVDELVPPGPKRDRLNAALKAVA